VSIFNLIPSQTLIRLTSGPSSIAACQPNNLFKKSGGMACFGFSQIISILRYNFLGSCLEQGQQLTIQSSHIELYI
jgi:hypothetical protein